MLKLCKFFVTEEYLQKLEDVLASKNVFEANQFRETHLIVLLDENYWPSEGEIAAEDIFAVDEATWKVFDEHLDCYFKVK